MKRTAAGAGLVAQRISRALGMTVVGAAGILMGACSSSPPPALYVLGSEPAPVAAATEQAGLPVVEVKPVGLPPYLDTTDLLVRHGSGLFVPSASGRWGERLSAGVTRALVVALASQAPRVAVTATPPVERPARQVLVDLDAFEPRIDGEVVLVARWSIVDSRGRTLASERLSLAETVAGTDDAAVVAAMTRATEALASRIAAALERTFGAFRGRG